MKIPMTYHEQGCRNRPGFWSKTSFASFFLQECRKLFCSFWQFFFQKPFIPLGQFKNHVNKTRWVGWRSFSKVGWPDIISLQSWWGFYYIQVILKCRELKFFNWYGQYSRAANSGASTESAWISKLWDVEVISSIKPRNTAVTKKLHSLILYKH